MWLIVGLGNPGDEYAQTRHNIGFRVIDALKHTFPSVNSPARELYSILFRTTIQTQSVVLIQPQTFMNRSGLAVEKVLSTFQASPDHLIVIYDDLDLPVGRLRIRTRGGHGGHKGVKSILDHITTSEFIRIRIGIGRPSSEELLRSEQTRDDVVDHVLQAFHPDENSLIDDVIIRASKAVELIVTDQLSQAMNVYNRG